MKGLDIPISNLLNCVYDRMTTDCCAPIYRSEIPPEFDPELICQEYLQFVKNNQSNEEYLIVLNKVIRRCPRNVKLWITKLNHLEETGSSLEEVSFDLYIK